MKLAICLAALALSAASSFAEEPQSPTAKDSPAKAEAPAATEAKPTPAAPAAAAVQPTVDKSDIVDKAATDKEIKTMRARGYKPVNRNGKLVYCRSEGEIGTHFEKTRCNTMEELRQAELSGKEYVNSIQQQGSPTQFKGDGPGR
jgi:hypothetical protein